MDHKHQDLAHEIKDLVNQRPQPNHAQQLNLSGNLLATNGTVITGVVLAKRAENIST